MHRVPWWLAGAGVAVQVTYPLTSGSASLIVTVLSVALLSAAALAHVFSVTGSPSAPVVVLLAAAGTGWLSEVIGVHTGFPFGSYRYTSLLGPSALGVPLLVPLAWTMLAYPCLLLGRRLVRSLAAPALPARGLAARGLAAPALAARRLWTAVLGGLTLASWDLFLDPQLVALGAWRWTYPSPALPGVPGVPLTNYAGWVGVSVCVIAVLDRALDVEGQLDELSPRAQAVPAAVLTWTWLGSLTGNLVFFARPAVAVYGGVAMGLFVVPYLRKLRSDALQDNHFHSDSGSG